MENNKNVWIAVAMYFGKISYGVDESSHLLGAFTSLESAESAAKEWIENKCNNSLGVFSDARGEEYDAPIYNNPDYEQLTCFGSPYYDHWRHGKIEFHFYKAELDSFNKDSDFEDLDYLGGGYYEE